MIDMYLLKFRHNMLLKRGGLNMYCEKCGTELTDEMVKCPKCGNEVKKEESNSEQSENKI